MQGSLPLDLGPESASLVSVSTQVLGAERTNLSPFTKDFRVPGIHIETQSLLEAAHWAAIGQQLRDRSPRALSNAPHLQLRVLKGRAGVLACRSLYW